MKHFRIVISWTGFIATSILVVTVVSLLTWYFIEGRELSAVFSSSHSSPRIIDPTERTILVVDGGFAPAVLIIPTGAVVTWENTSPAQARIASDSPQARYLPEILTHALKQGERFSFSFVLPGEWHYHNVAHPEWGGKIIIQ